MAGYSNQEDDIGIRHYTSEIQCRKSKSKIHSYMYSPCYSVYSISAEAWLLTSNGSLMDGLMMEGRTMAQGMSPISFSISLSVTAFV